MYLCIDFSLNTYLRLAQLYLRIIFTNLPQNNAGSNRIYVVKWYCVVQNLRKLLKIEQFSRVERVCQPIFVTGLPVTKCFNLTPCRGLSHPPGPRPVSTTLHSCCPIIKYKFIYRIILSKQLFKRNLFKNVTNCIMVGSLRCLQFLS